MAYEKLVILDTIFWLQSNMELGIVHCKTSHSTPMSFMDAGGGPGVGEKNLIDVTCYPFVSS